MAVAALPAAAQVVRADPPQPTYVDAVQRAYDLIQGASPQDAAPARSAFLVLEQGTGDTQPEILADLSARPPRYDDASRRLDALLTALQQPAMASDPGLAQQRLRDVLAMSRYDALRRPPSLLDRLEQWINDRITQLLRLLFGNGSGTQPQMIFFYLVGLAVVGAVIYLLAGSARGRFSQSARLPSAGPRAPADYFAEADRLAVKGDRVGAIRALCAGVAGTLAGERTWEGSPLTVREIFQRSPDHVALRALLLPFEAAIYGGRDVDEATYARAARVAEPFRHPAVKEGAAA